MTPPAPGWLLMTMVAPSALDSSFIAVRVIVSTPEAAATGRMNWTVLPVVCCAHVGPVMPPAASAAPLASNARREIVMSLIF
jgi:hypothetical protein